MERHIKRLGAAILSGLLIGAVPVSAFATSAGLETITENESLEATEEESTEDGIDGAEPIEGNAEQTNEETGEEIQENTEEGITGADDTSNTGSENTSGISAAKEYTFHTGSNTEGDDIEDVQKTYLDEDGYATIQMTVEDTVALPVTVTMSDGEHGTIITIRENGELIKVKPGAYTVTKAIDGNNKKLSSGASLTINEDTEIIYFDFTKPENEFFTLFKDMLFANIIFIPVLLLIWYGYKWYIKNC